MRSRMEIRKPRLKNLILNLVGWEFQLGLVGLEVSVSRYFG